MKHRSESLSRALAIAVVCIVATILALSFVGYVGERLTTLHQTMQANRG